MLYIPSIIRKLLIVALAAIMLIGPAIAHADYLPEAYAGCAEIKGKNPHYLTRKQQQKTDL